MLKCFSLRLQKSAIYFKKLKGNDSHFWTGVLLKFTATPKAGYLDYLCSEDSRDTVENARANDPYPFGNSQEKTASLNYYNPTPMKGFLFQIVKEETGNGILTMIMIKQHSDGYD